jgi:hypothetical protein
MSIVSDEDLKMLAAGTFASSSFAFRPPIRHKGPAPYCTFEALMYSLRSGPYVLEHPNVEERLSRIDSSQLQEACARVMRHKPHISRPWTSDETRQLVKAWQACRHRERRATLKRLQAWLNRG